MLKPIHDTPTTASYKFDNVCLESLNVKDFIRKMYAEQFAIMTILNIVAMSRGLFVGHCCLRVCSKTVLP